MNEKPRIKSTDLKLIREFRKGAFVITDGANYSLENSMINSKSDLLRRLIESGVLVESFHEAKSFDEKKYIIDSNFDLSKELKNIQEYRKKERQKFGNVE